MTEDFNEAKMVEILKFLLAHNLRARKHLASNISMSRKLAWASEATEKNINSIVALLGTRAYEEN